jgi:CRP-like cAMP-binding protein
LPLIAIDCQVIIRQNEPGHACAHYGASLSPQVIIRQNEPGHSFFIVKEGEVQCFVNQKLVKTYGPSEYFGEGLIASDCV